MQLQAQQSYNSKHCAKLAVLEGKVHPHNRKLCNYVMGLPAVFESSGSESSSISHTGALRVEKVVS